MVAQLKDNIAMGLMLTMSPEMVECAAKRYLAIENRRFRASRALKADLGVLHTDEEVDAAVKGGEGGQGAMKRSGASATSPPRKRIPRSFVPSKSIKKGPLKANKSKNKTTPTKGTKKKKKMASTVRPSTTIAGTKSMGGLRATM